LLMADLQPFRSSQPANNPAGADCPEILVLLQRLLAAAQPERYAAARQIINRYRHRT
jgi:hypothetical protein